MGEAWELPEEVELVVEGFTLGLLPGVEDEFFVVLLVVLVAGAGVGAGVGAGAGVVLLAVEAGAGVGFTWAGVELEDVFEAGAAGVELFVLEVPLVVVVVEELVVG